MTAFGLGLVTGAVVATLVVRWWRRLGVAIEEMDERLAALRESGLL